MNLKNNQITVQELLANPGAKAVFQKRFPKVMTHPMLAAAGSLTLVQVLAFAKMYVPQQVINETLRELERL